MALLEGTTDNPSSPPSQDFVKLLKSHGVKYVALNTVQRKDLLDALTQAGVVSSVPSLFVDGQLVGDLDSVTKMEQVGELVKRIPAECMVETLESRLKRLVNQNKVMLFMKGSPKAPQCGFSQKIVNLLNGYNIEYGSFDIFKDEQVREGLKKYSNWPTYP